MVDDIKVWKGLATIKGENFCAQPYHICAECDAREELGCKDAVITLEIVQLKEDDILQKGLNKTLDTFKVINRNMDKVTEKSTRITRELKAISSTLKKGRSWKIK